VLYGKSVALVSIDLVIDPPQCEVCMIERRIITHVGRESAVPAPEV
jgi:hypothetical protein